MTTSAGRAALALALACVVLGGCLSHAPQRAATPAPAGPEGMVVQDALRTPFTATALDGTQLSAVAYVPQVRQSGGDGLAPRWPVVVFLHGWGGSKEDYEGSSGHRLPAVGEPPAAADPSAGENVLRRFALAGMLAVAYDARGFGASGGQTTVAGPAEQADLDAVIDETVHEFPTSDRVGVVGQSYGGGQALLAWARDARVTAVVAQYGWADLYGALLPGNVPKLEWAQELYGYGLPGSQARYSDMVHRWYQNLYTRSDLDTMHVEMDARSILGSGSAKPLYLCQGIDETLFPQFDQELADATRAGAFVRVSLLPGGHGAQWSACWDRTQAWFAFFLAGVDTHVDAWPVLSTADVTQAATANFTVVPDARHQTLWLRNVGSELASEATTSSVTVTGTSGANPFAEPAGLSDKGGQSPAPLPDPLRDDPTATSFTLHPLDQAATLFGAATLTLVPANGTLPPFQVAAQLQLVAADGTTRIIGHAAFAAVAASDLSDRVVLSFPWTKATLAKGDALRVTIAGNDASWFTPLGSPYTVTFSGANRLDVPWLPLQTRPGA